MWHGNTVATILPLRTELYLQIVSLMGSLYLAVRQSERNATTSLHQLPSNATIEAKKRHCRLSVAEVRTCLGRLHWGNGTDHTTQLCIWG